MKKFGSDWGYSVVVIVLAISFCFWAFRSGCAREEAMDRLVSAVEKLAAKECGGK